MKNKNQKSWKELFSINKVITLLKFKSALNLQICIEFAVFLIGGAIKRARPNEISQ